MKKILEDVINGDITWCGWVDEGEGGDLGGTWH